MSSPGTTLNSIATRDTVAPTPPPTLVVPAPTPSDPTATTRVGTSGIYTNPGGSLTVGAANIGNISGFESYQVPDTTSGIRFDQFPCAPSVADGSKIVYKGNWVDAAGVGQTGVYWRDVSDPLSSSFRIADSTMMIPGESVLFGSTAPPSAANGNAVFLGVDNEEKPSAGGIFSASLTLAPTLDAVALIGQAAPGFDPLFGDNTFTSLGEALSFDGRYVAFWAGVGDQMQTLTLHCPEDGNADRLQYCLYGPDGLPDTGENLIRLRFPSPSIRASTLRTFGTTLSI